MVTIAEAMMSWLRECPELADGKLRIDWLPEDAREFSIDVVPCTPQIKRYTGGKTLKQFQFNLASRVFVGADVRDAMDNYEFYEAFADWVQSRNKKREWPELGGNREARGIQVNTSGYPMLIRDDGLARYQIQLTLKYEEE